MHLSSRLPFLKPAASLALVVLASAAVLLHFTRRLVADDLVRVESCGLCELPDG